MEMAVKKDEIADDRLLTTAEVAKLLGLSKSWVEQARRKGMGPKFVRIGNKACRYRLSDARSYMSQLGNSEG